MTPPDRAALARTNREHVWPPFTHLAEWRDADPVFIDRGEGNWLIDVDGNRYLDGVSSLWANVHGHRRPEIDAAIRAQLDRIAHTTMLGLANVPATELAGELVKIVPPGLTRVFYSDAGATATEIALKLAFQHAAIRGEKRRTLFASLVGAYHGDTIGAMSVGYCEPFHRPFDPLLFPRIQLTPPHVLRFEQGLDADEALERALEEAREQIALNAEELAAVFVEPLMQGAAGMWDHPVAYLRGLREITREHGVLLVADEVATGFGRTGRMFACEHAGVTPDILCVAKGITGGYLPLAATITTEAVFETFLGRAGEGRTFFHGHTYTGNPLGAAAALANLEIFERERVIERLAPRIERLGALLDAQVKPLAHVADVRRWGVMTGIELLRDVEKREPWPVERRLGHRVILAARRRGVAIRPLGDVIILMPPLSITSEELELLVGATAESIAEATAAIDPA